MPTSNISNQILFSVTFRFAEHTQTFFSVARGRFEAYNKVMTIIGRENVGTPKQLVSIKTSADINHI